MYALLARNDCIIILYLYCSVCSYVYLPSKIIHTIAFISFPVYINYLMSYLFPSPKNHTNSTADLSSLLAVFIAGTSFTNSISNILQGLVAEHHHLCVHVKGNITML